MTRPFILSAVFLLITCVARSTLASDTCTVMYRLDATLEVSDTEMGKGDKTVDGLKGSLVMEYPQDAQGRVTDGKVRILHYAMYEHFEINALVTITTAIHHFTPTCNGTDEPNWRRVTDNGFPATCEYTGNEDPVATGTLRREDRTIEWKRCKAASSYWSRDRRAYTPSDKSKGKGCLEKLHGVGNVHCDGRLACKWGGLRRGDNPVFDVWTQPLIHGPPDSTHSVTVSEDLSSITTPVHRKDGHQSYNLPNNSPSRTWFAWTASRNDSSRFTTCP